MRNNLGFGCRAIVAGLAALVVGFAPEAARGEAGTARFATDAAGFIPYWIGVGPIPVSPEEGGGKALDVDYLKGETNLAPRAGDRIIVNGQELTWKAVTVKDGSPQVDGELSFGKRDNAVIYLVAYVVLEREVPGACLFWGSDDSGAVLVNGREVGRYAGGRTCSPDSDCTQDFPLRKGVNTIAMKVVNGALGYFACARLVGPDGKVLTGVALAAAPDGQPAPDGAWPLVATGQKPPAESPNTCDLVASQIGYSPNGQKLAIAASRRNRTWNAIELRDAATDRPVFRIPVDGGSIVSTGLRADVGQFVSRVYFGPFQKPGRYYLFSPEHGARSFAFNIQDNVFLDAARVITRAFYFQRHGQAFDGKHAGPWAGPAYHDTNSAARATVHEWAGGNWLHVGGKEIDPTPRDVRGGWYDAGDPNKYTLNTVLAHNVLLWTFDMNRRFLTDGELNIPESGNRVPDLLDEARWGAEYLLRVRDAEGRVFDRVAHGDARAGATQIAEPCSGATLCTIGALAWSAAVWQEGGWDRAFAARCLKAAEESWAYMEAHPSPWPVDAAGKRRAIGSIDGGYQDERAWRNVAASALFRATGKEAYRKVAEEAFDKPAGEASIGRWIHQIQVCHNYMLAKGHDPERVQAYARRIEPSVRGYRDNVSPRSRYYAYGAGWPVYCWSSNSGVAQEAAGMAWWAIYFAPPAEQPAYAQAAEEYFHYLLGRNPTRWCYVTSLQSAGAEHSCQIMFHFLCRHDASLPGGDNKWLTPGADHPGRIGCYPGYLVGGPMPTITSFGFDPNRPSDDYVHMEPSIVYQCHMVAMASYCAYQAREHRSLQKGAPPDNPTELALPVAVPPDDRQLRFTGRFDASDPQGPRCAWPGSSITATFEGSAVNARLRCSGNEDYVLAIVDGKPAGVVRVVKSETLYRVADGLPAGTHTLTLFKRTEPLVGTLQFLGLQLERGGALKAPPGRPRRWIEFVGDSITCGYGNLAASQSEHFAAGTEDNYQAYGAITARSLGAEYTAIAWSGKWLIGDNSIVPLYDTALPGSAGSVWAFADGAPDVLVINLGTNDFGGKETPDKAAWTDAYLAFILRLRKVAPQAHVFLVSGPMINDWDPYWRKGATVIRGYLADVVARRRAEGDARIHVVEFTPQTTADGYGADWHPSLKTHQAMAATLTAAIRKEMGW